MKNKNKNKKNAVMLKGTAKGISIYGSKMCFTSRTIAEAIAECKRDHNITF